MRLKIDYIDNSIDISESFVNVIEIENKDYFYKLVNDFNMISSGELNENIAFFDNKYNEINLINKFILFIDYFNLKSYLKKYSNNLYKFINLELTEENKLEISNVYKKMLKIIKKNFSDIDISFIFNEDIDFNNLFKILKIDIDIKSNLLDNLFLIIDLEKKMNLFQILIFVNLKQYLNKKELIELYKYSIYNEVSIILIDSQSYGISLDFEKKIIIDENLDEFVI